MSEENKYCDKKVARTGSVAAKRKRSEDPLINWTRPPREDCPICMLPMPLDIMEVTYSSCCGNSFCNGCLHDLILADVKEGRSTVEESRARFCPFCRTECVAEDDILKYDMKLAKSGHRHAIYLVGGSHFDGEHGLTQNKAEGIKWWRRATEAGSPEAAHRLGCCSEEGDGVEQDNDKALECYKKAAERGDVDAFVSIGSLLAQKGEIEEALLNYRKAALCGLSEPESLLSLLEKGYSDGYMTKEEYDFTLRENKKVRNEMKSESREMAKELEEDIRNGEGNE